MRTLLILLAVASALVSPMLLLEQWGGWLGFYGPGGLLANSQQVLGALMLCVLTPVALILLAAAKA